jgi:hypothetical protein
MVLAEKDSEITEIEAASTGEAARLKATLEEIKGELAHLKDQHVCHPIVCQLFPLMVNISDTKLVGILLPPVGKVCRRE